jgi:hypothetical protein
MGVAKLWDNNMNDNIPNGQPEVLTNSEGKRRCWKGELLFFLG